MFNSSYPIKLLVSAVALASAISAPAAMAGMHSSPDKQAAQESPMMATESKQTIVDIASYSSRKTRPS